MKVWVTCNGDGLVKALSSKAKAKEYRTGLTDEDAPSNIGGVAGGFTYGGTPPCLLPPPSPEGGKAQKTHGDPFEVPGVMVGNAVFITCLREGSRCLDVGGCFNDESKAKKNTSPPHQVKASGISPGDYAVERLILE